MSHPDRPTDDSPEPDVPGGHRAERDPEPNLTPPAAGGDETIRRSPGRTFVRIVLSFLFVLLLVLASMTLIGDRAGAVEAGGDAESTSEPEAGDDAEAGDGSGSDTGSGSESRPSAEVDGTPFDFADSVGDAQYLAEGHYVSELDPAGNGGQEPKYIGLAVPDGITVHVSVVPLPEEEMDGSVIVRSVNSRDECETAGEQEFSNLEEPGRVGEAAVLELEQDSAGSCAVGGWTLEVTGDFAGDTDAAVPIEMSVQFEETDDEAADESTSSNDEASDPVSLEDPESAEGGTTFLSAETITEGAYESTVMPGKSQVYSLPVQWGQQPVVTLRSGPSERDTAETVSVTLLNPLWEQVEDGPLNFYDEARDRTIGADRPLSAANRDRGRGAGVTAVAGDYYVVVSMNAQRVDSDDDDPQPYTFGVELRGSPESGPSWRPLQEAGPEPSDVPVDAAGDPLPEEVLAEAEEAADEDVAEAEAEEDEDNSTLWGALFALGLIIAVGVVVFVGRRGD